MVYIEGMTNLSLTTDQMSAAASYLSREWGDYGYRIEGIESPSWVISLFRIVHSDGSRFTIAADKWGNVKDWTHEPASQAEQQLVADMHDRARAA